MTTNKVTRGGKREGAGRKPNPRKVLYVRVNEHTLATLKATAQRQMCTIGEVIEELVKKSEA